MKSYSGCLNVGKRVQIETLLTSTGWRCFGRLFVTVYDGKETTSAGERESYVCNELEKILHNTFKVTFLEDESNEDYDIFSLPHSCCMAILSLPDYQCGDTQGTKTKDRICLVTQVHFVMPGKIVVYDLIVTQKELHDLMDTVEYGKTHLTTARDVYKWNYKK